MTRILASLALLLALAMPGAAAADCYAHYKAKRDNPLRLHYGIVQLPGSCPSAGRAADTVAGRIASDGWTLLNVVKVSAAAPSAGEIANAGAYYLRY